MKVGKTIRELRKELGMNQQEFSTKCGIGQTALSQIELGETNPNQFTMAKICKTLQVDEPLIIAMSIERNDVPEQNKDLYDLLYPTVLEFMQKIFKHTN